MFSCRGGPLPTPLRKDQEEGPRDNRMPETFTQQDSNECANCEMLSQLIFLGLLWIARRDRGGGFSCSLDIVGQPQRPCLIWAQR